MYIQVEEVTLPFRFLLITGHFIAVLAVVFDFDRIVSCITEVDPTRATGPDLNDFTDTKQTLEGLAYASVACFCIEYITLFLGVSIFLRHITILNIIAHLGGLLLTVLFYADCWNIGAFAAFFVIFSLIPMLVDLGALFFCSKLAIFIKY